MKKMLRPQIGVLLLVSASLLVGWRPLVDTFALALNSDELTYILLILPISATLIVLEWHSLRPLASPDFRFGSALLLCAILLVCLRSGWSASLAPDTQLSMSMLALVLWWIGSFVFWFGSRASRVALFPLSFLFGIVPPPGLVLNPIVTVLQQGSASAAHGLFSIVGIPVAQTGIFLSIPGLTMQVAQECSSIRSSTMLLLTTIVLSQLLLRAAWRKFVVIILSIPLSIAKNGLRVFTIGALGTRVDPGYLNGRLHHQGGIVFFVLALIVVIAVLWFFRRSEEMPLQSGLNP